MRCIRTERSQVVTQGKPAEVRPVLARSRLIAVLCGIARAAAAKACSDVGRSLFTRETLGERGRSDVRGWQAISRCVFARHLLTLIHTTV